MDTAEAKKQRSSQNFFLTDYAILFYLAFVKCLVHFSVNLAGAYGYFRDEFYYIACSNHMAWGYVDQPPLSIALLLLNRLLLGDSLFALRLLPAIAGGVAVALAGAMTKELGGSRFAQIMAACCAVAAPQLLGTNSIYSMNSFDVLFWTLAIYLFIIILKHDKQKHWILLGLVLGLGLLNKISVLWLGAGIAAGLIFTPNRLMLRKPNVWLAAAIAFCLFLPHVFWQMKLGFPTLEFIKNATQNKYVAESPLGMFLQQSLNMNPPTFLLWFPGLVYFLVSKSVRQFRMLPVIYVTVFLILAINRTSKAEYLGPMFPMLFAMGACTFEKFVAKVDWRWLRPVMLTLVLCSGIISAPFAIAVLPVKTFIAYSKALGMAPSTPEKKEVGRLPQFYADMFGWEKMAAAVSDAYSLLPPEEKTQCFFIGNNYGEAGAVEFYAQKYVLPKVICGHNNYWLWGPKDATGETVIRIGGNVEAMKESYREVLQVSMFTDDYCMPYENNMPIRICKRRRTPLKDDWAQFKHYE